MPDIDIDFSVRGRERVIRYVTEKYGADRVAQIITFGKMFPRAATRDAARVLGHDYGGGGQAREADPGPDHGPPAELRGVPGSRAPTSPPRSRATRSPSRSSTSPRASRASSATPRSTPPRS